MAKGVQTWSGTPASNATADSNVNFSEGMAPSQVNDSGRGLMASVANWRDDNNGTLISGGTTSALTLVTNQVEGSLVSGYTVSFQFGTGVAANATLAVDGLTAKPLQLYPGHALLGDEFSAGSNACWTYSTTGTGQWIWKGQPAFTVLTNSLASPVSVASTAAYFDGPVVTQGSSGVWFAIGTVSFSASGGSNNIAAKLWDGTTAISGCSGRGDIAGAVGNMSLSGIMVSPAGNLRISVAKQLNTAVSITSSAANMVDGLKASTLTVIRIG